VRNSWQLLTHGESGIAGHTVLLTYCIIIHIGTINGCYLYHRPPCWTQHIC